MEQLAEAVQQITGENVELAYVDQDYTGENAAQATEKHGIQLEVVKHTEAKRGFVLLPRRWVVERSFAWAARFRDWPEITNASPRPSPVSTTSPSPYSCSPNSSRPPDKANNRLQSRLSSWLDFYGRHFSPGRRHVLCDLNTFKNATFSCTVCTDPFCHRTHAIRQGCLNALAEYAFGF